MGWGAKRARKRAATGYTCRKQSTRNGHCLRALGLRRQYSISSVTHTARRPHARGYEKCFGIVTLRSKPAAQVI